MEQEIVDVPMPPFPIDAFNLGLFSAALNNTDSLVCRLKAEQAKNAELCEKLKSLNESAMHMKNLYESEKSKKLEIQSNDILYELKYTALLDNFNKFSNETCNAELLHQQTISELENSLKTSREECLRQSEAVVKLGNALKAYGGMSTATKRSIARAKEILNNEGRVVNLGKIPRSTKTSISKKEALINTSVQSKSTQTEAIEESEESAEEDNFCEAPVESGSSPEIEPMKPPAATLTPTKCTIGTNTEQTLLNSPSKSRSTTTRSTCTSVFIKKVDFCCNFPECQPISVEEIFKETIIDLSHMLGDPIVEMREPIPNTCDIACQTTNVDVTVNRRSIGIGTDTPVLKKSDIFATDFLLEKIKKEAISPFGSMCNLSSFQYKGSRDDPSENCSQLSQIWQLLGETIFTIMRNERSYQQSATDVTVINRNIEKIKELIEVEKQLANDVEKPGYEWQTSSDENEESEGCSPEKQMEEDLPGFLGPNETEIHADASPPKENPEANVTKILLSPILEEPRVQQLETAPEKLRSVPKRRSARLASIDSDSSTNGGPILEPNLENILATPPKPRKRIRTTSSSEETPAVPTSNEVSAIENRSLKLAGIIRRSPRLSSGFQEPIFWEKPTKKRTRKSSVSESDKHDRAQSQEHNEKFDDIEVPKLMQNIPMLSPLKATPKCRKKNHESQETDDESPTKLCLAYKLPSLIEPLSDIDDDLFVMFESPESPLSEVLEDTMPLEIPLDRIYDPDESPRSPAPESEEDETIIHSPIVIPLDHICLADCPDDGPAGFNKLSDSTSAVADALRCYDVRKRRGIVNRDQKETEHDIKAIYKNRVAIEQYLDGDWTSEALHLCCDKLTRNGAKLKLLVTSLLEIIEDNSGEEVNVAMTPPAPPIPLTQQKLLVLVRTLSAYHQKSFERVVLYELDRKLFSLKSDTSSTPDKKLERMLTLAHFYIGMIDMTSGEASMARIFVYKALYYHGFMAIPMIYQLLQVFPHVLPRKSNTEYDNSDPVISTLQTLLMAPANFAETNCNINSAYKKRNLLSLLQKYYGYTLGHPTPEELIQNLLGKLAADKLDNLDYCLILLAKRNGHEWAMQKLVQPHLYPALNELLSVAEPTAPVEAKQVLLIGTIASILKTSPKTQDKTQILQLFTNILETSQRPAVQEAAIESLLKFQRFGCVEVFKRLQSWTPTVPLSRRCRTMLDTFIYRRDFGFWKKLMHQI